MVSLLSLNVLKFCVGLNIQINIRGIVQIYDWGE